MKTFQSERSFAARIGLWLGTFFVPLSKAWTFLWPRLRKLPQFLPALFFVLFGFTQAFANGSSFSWKNEFIPASQNKPRASKSEIQNQLQQAITSHFAAHPPALVPSSQTKFDSIFDAKCSSSDPQSRSKHLFDMVRVASKASGRLLFNKAVRILSETYDRFTFTLDSPIFSELQRFARQNQIHFNPFTAVVVHPNPEHIFMASESNIDSNFQYLAIAFTQNSLLSNAVLPLRFREFYFCEWNLPIEESFSFAIPEFSALADSLYQILFGSADVIALNEKMLTSQKIQKELALSFMAHELRHIHNWRGHFAYDASIGELESKLKYESQSFSANRLAKISVSLRGNETAINNKIREACLDYKNKKECRLFALEKITKELESDGNAKVAPFLAHYGQKDEISAYLFQVQFLKTIGYRFENIEDAFNEIYRSGLPSLEDRLQSDTLMIWYLRTLFNFAAPST